MSRQLIRSIVSAAVAAAFVVALLPEDAFAQRGGGGGQGSSQGTAAPARPSGPGPGGPGPGGGRGGPGVGGPGARGQVVVVGGYGYPHGWYSPYYGYGYYGWGWGLGWGWGYPYPFYSPWYPYGYPYYYDAFNASLKLEVTPKNAEVYVDGYLAGIVDDFDGTFQRLKVRPGTHEIVLWLEGYRTVQQELHLATDTSKRIKFAMEPLAPGETSGPRPTPPPEPVEEPQPQRRAPPQRQLQVEPQQDPVQQVPAQFGQLSVRVQPADAEILVDGERWDSPAGARLVVQLAPGRHKVEIRKEGFNTYSEEVLIRAGSTMTLNVSLLRFVPDLPHAPSGIDGPMGLGGKER